MLIQKYSGTSSQQIVKSFSSLFDNRTVLGKTLDMLCKLCDKEDLSLLSSNCVKSKLSYYNVPDEEMWRVETVTELLNLRDQSLYLPGFTNEEINTMLVFTCTS